LITLNDVLVEAPDKGREKKMGEDNAVGNWLLILESLPLTKSERATVERFARDPQGRSFLAVADILRSHKRIDDSLELLTQGLNRHPTFSVSRVVLARELYHRGMIFAAWQTIEDSPTPLAENVLAQKLRYRLSILLGYGAVAREVFEHLTRYKMVDDEIRRLSDLVALSGLERGRDYIFQELRSRGVEPVVPENIDVNGADQQGTQAQSNKNVANKPQAISHVSSRDSMHIEGFHVMPLSEVFRIDSDNEEKFQVPGEAVELDSTTLAEIYAKQGHYTRALGVYRRLLKLNPNNDFLRKKVQQLGKLEREQRETDLTLDPGMVDQFEQLEIVESQIKFYQKMLNRLQG